MSQTTTFVILTLDETGRWTQRAGTIDAANSGLAVREYAGREGEADWVGYVAVPARSWNPVQLEVPKVPAFKLTPLAQVELPVNNPDEAA